MVMRTKKSLFNWMAIACLGFALTACDSDEKNARLQVWLTDAPGDYEAVNIEVIGVEVHVGEGEGESGWKSLDTETGIYNLLDLTNGLDTLLGEIEIPAGKISQIRLKLGNENSIQVDGEEYDLSTPSAQQSGLKLQVHETLSAGITYKILLDFDVARSIVVTGNETYKLKPVIRTITKAADGAIKGKVNPKESTPAVYAIVDLDTVATTFADSTGAFLLRGLSGGTYNVSIVPNSSYQPVLKENVSVSIGTVTDLGVIEME
jgi:hypothetical protein